MDCKTIDVGFNSIDKILHIADIHIRNYTRHKEYRKVFKELYSGYSYHVKQEISFDTDYNIDIITNTISPDPYDQGDSLFMNMVCMKAACMMDQSLFRSRALMSGLEAKCGPATLTTNKYLQGFKDLIELGPCAIYDKLKEENAFSGDLLNDLVHFVLSPFVGNEFDPTTSLHTSYDDERNFK